MGTRPLAATRRVANPSGLMKQGLQPQPDGSGRRLSGMRLSTPLESTGPCRVLPHICSVKCRVTYAYVWAERLNVYRMVSIAALEAVSAAVGTENVRYS